MSDTFTNPKRSAFISRIWSHVNVAPELRYIRLLKDSLISGWRRKQKIFGKPDFVFPKLKLAVFVDGLFLARCPRCYSEP